MILFKHHLTLILIVLVVQIRMEPAAVEEDDYDDYEYNDLKQQQVNSLSSESENERNIPENKIQERNSRNLPENDRQERDQEKRSQEDQNERAVDYVDERYADKLNAKYDDISKYQNLKYENDKNYGTVRNSYELIDEEENEEDEANRNDKIRADSDRNDENQNEDRDDKNNSNNDDQTSKEPKEQKEQIKFVSNNNRLKPKVKKAQVKLIKEIRYPKSASARPKYYYPGRNFVHQRPSNKKDAKISKLKMKSNKFVNDDLSTLIPLELYKHQVRSRFVSSSEYSEDGGDGRSSRLMDELEVPQILNGELYCDCGFYLKLKNKKINKLNSKLKKVSNEQRQMKRKLIEMAVKENQLQLICRSQSKANLKYINNNGKPGYLALSNATSQSNPIDLI